MIPLSVKETEVVGVRGRDHRLSLGKIRTALLPTDSSDGQSSIPVALSPRPMDIPRHTIELVSAYLRRRNAPHHPARRRCIDDWQLQGPGPGPTRPGRTRPLIFGIMAVWNEEDIIYAGVRNLLDQGVDRVFVVDDGSDDATVSEALEAGAEVTRDPHETFRETGMTAKIATQIWQQTYDEGQDVWWVIADGDEFPGGPNGATIRELVEELPDWVDVVGSRVLEHYPRGPRDYEVREHPLLSLPLATWYRNPYCSVGHWKHQLLRVREPGDVVPLHGHHTVKTKDGRRAREFSASLLMHHFPFRNRDHTEARLRRLGSRGGRYAMSPDAFLMARLEVRLRMLDHIYEGRFELLPNPFPGERKVGLDVKDWRELISTDERRMM